MRPGPSLPGLLASELGALATRHEVPGSSIAVLHDGEVTAAATGVLSTGTGVEATTDSLFQAGSITKTYVATLVMQLVEDGRLDLDVPIRTYLPELTLADAGATDRITVRHLLDHTSGIGGDHFRDHGRGDECIERYVAGLSDVPVEGRPGHRFSYCNSGFVLAARLLERLHDEPWERVLARRLLDPLGLDRTVTLPEEAILHRTAVGHERGPDGSVRPVRRWSFPRTIGPAGGIVASATDVVRFVAALLRGDGGLSADLVATMWTPSVELPPSHMAAAWGLGWAVYRTAPEPLVGHDGSTIGQVASLRVDPGRGVAVALLANGPGGAAMSRELLPPVLAATGCPPPPRLPSPGGGLPAEPSRYTGEYRRHAVTTVVTEGPGHLTATMVPAGDFDRAGAKPVALDLLAVDERTFVGRSDGTGDVLVHFGEPGPDGRFSTLFSSRVARRVRESGPGAT